MGLRIPGQVTRLTLDRWLALLLTALFVLYGYEAYFTLDKLLPPILRANPLWPSSFPKVITVAGIVLSLAVVLNVEKSSPYAPEGEIDYRRLLSYKLRTALALVALMVAYALTLRALGFIAATFLFLTIGGLVLGERRYVLLGAVNLVAAGGIWYLVHKVLKIYMTPLPAVFTST